MGWESTREPSKGAGSAQEERKMGTVVLDLAPEIQTYSDPYCLTCNWPLSPQQGWEQLAADPKPAQPRRSSMEAPEEHINDPISILFLAPGAWRTLHRV